MSIDGLTPAQQFAALDTVRAYAQVIAHGPNPDRDLVSRVKQSATPDALLARLNMNEAVLRGPNIFSDPLAKHNYITGRARRGRSRFHRANSWSPSPRKSKEMNLIFPVRMPRRVIDANGGRSFHMRETPVHARGSFKSCQAKVRQNYTLDGSRVPIVDALLAEEALERGLYLFRDSSKPHREGIRFAVTNLGKNDPEVVKAWQFIGRNEIKRVGKPIARHITIDRSKTPAGDRFWEDAAAHPDAPEGFLDSIWKAGSSRKAIFWDDEARAVECFLRKRGWHDRAKAKQRLDVTFHRGRAPIIQRRLVCELPQECDLEAIERIINNLAKEFKRRNLPFVLVVHRPDAHNHKSNWHLHLDYPHRPMQRFYASSFELSPLPSGAGAKQIARHRLATEALANALPDWEGMWDCEIEYTYRTHAGKKKTCKPFIQDTHAEFRGDWLKSSRSWFADIVNAELDGLGGSERFDPKTFEERGIEKEAEVHLGLSASRAEREGRPTLSGATNEQKQYDYEVGELKKKHPGGDTAEGDPKIVAAYAADILDLICKRLSSRPEFISYYARREIDEAYGFNPTATSRNTRKTGNRQAIRRMRDAEDALSVIREIYVVIVEKSIEAARDIVHVADKSAAPARALNEAVPNNATPQRVTQRDTVPATAGAPSNRSTEANEKPVHPEERHSKSERSVTKPANFSEAASQTSPGNTKPVIGKAKGDLSDRNTQPPDRQKGQAELARNALQGLREMGAGSSAISPPRPDKSGSPPPISRTAITGGRPTDIAERNVAAKAPPPPSQNTPDLGGGSTPDQTGVSMGHPPAVMSPAISAVQTFIDDARKRKVAIQRGDDGVVRREGHPRDPAFEAELTKPHHQVKLLVIAEEHAEELNAIDKVAETNPAMLREWADPKRRHPELPQSVLKALIKWSGQEDVMSWLPNCPRRGLMRQPSFTTKKMRRADPKRGRVRLRRLVNVRWGRLSWPTSSHRPV